MEETPVIESTELETTTDETTLESTESAETGAESTDETTTGGDETSEQQEGEQTETNEPAINGTKLSAAAKATLDEIRGKNPKLAAELKSALFEREALKSVIPGGVNAVKELNQKLTEFGGFEGIEQLKSDVGYWNELDQRFTAGDPAFIEEIATASPEAFVKLIPSAFAKYQEVSPDGFSKYMAGIFQNDMHQAGLFNALDRLSDFLPADQPRVKELWAQVTNYLNRVGQLANQDVKPIAQKEQPRQDDQFAAERAKFDKERDEFQRTQYASESNTERVKVFNTSWAKLTANLKLTSEQSAAAKELYLNRLMKTLQGTDFQATAEKYYKAGDKAGYLRYTTSMYSQHIPKAIESALASLGVHKKPGPRPSQQQNQTQQTQTTRPEFQTSLNRPKSGDIDWTRTSQSMYLKGQAVLKDGKKVQFKR